MKKTAFILFIVAFGAITAPAYAQEAFRYDTIRRAERPSREIVGTPQTQRGTQMRQENRPQRYAPATTPHKKKPQGYWTFGGNLGFGFGDYTAINVAPQMGYRFNKTLGVGGGFNYNYYEHRHLDYTLNYFGMNVYAQIFPVRYITLFVQPELQRRWGRVWGYDDRSELFGCLLIGGGLAIPTSPRGAMTVTFYYDLIQNRYSPHGDNVGYSVGYTFRL